MEIKGGNSSWPFPFWRVTRTENYAFYMLSSSSSPFPSDIQYEQIYWTGLNNSRHSI